MNLRDIKKDINYVLGAFVDDCALFLTVNPGKNSEEVTDLIDEAAELNNALRDKIVAPEAKAAGKSAYFDAIRKELLEKVDALYDRLTAAVKKGLEPEAPAAPAPKKPRAKKAKEEPAAE